MAGKALQLHMIAYNAKRRRVWHKGRQLVRDGERCSALSFVPRSTGISLWKTESGTKRDEHASRSLGSSLNIEKYHGLHEMMSNWGSRRAGCNLSGL